MAFMQKASRIWARLMIRGTGSRLDVTGLQNIPDSNVVVIANHQSQLDILAILAVIPRQIGFIAKKELAILPIMNLWMLILRCVFIDRKNMRKSARAIDRGVRNLKKGYSMVIFPEGTRSKGGPMKPFKPGSLKLAVRAQVPILPVTLDGTYRIFEEHYRIRPARIKVIIHPAVQTRQLSGQDLDTLPGLLFNRIQAAL